MARPLDIVERELIDINAKIKLLRGQAVHDDVGKELFLVEGKLRNEYETIKDGDEICYNLRCRQHTGPDYIRCENHR